jgi:hypothetical protein
MIKGWTNKRDRRVMEKRREGDKGIGKHGEE